MKFRWQPRPQGLLAFQYGCRRHIGKREDPGDQVVGSVQIHADSTRVHIFCNLNRCYFKGGLFTCFVVQMKRASNQVREQ